MKAQKVTVKIKANCLDIDSLRGMLIHAIDEISNEAESGKLKMRDGDFIEWNTSRKNVVF